MVDYDSAAQAVQDENADPAFLARIAYENPEFGPNVAAHPRAYPGLLAWIAQFGTAEAKQIVARRRNELPQGASINNDEPSASSPAADAQSAASAHPIISTQSATNAQPTATAQPAPRSAEPVREKSATEKPVQERPVQERPMPVKAEPSQPSHGFTPVQALDPTTDPMTQHNIAEYAPELRVYLAQNPSIYPELLAWLGTLHDPDIDAAIAARDSH
ncbi:MAG: hypothetical protein LKJ44_04085 [Bifidobacteriaceae bacterium]|jgi:hypothetical protein|nr:hypothetical protein [Bifidobacteriaceae bacterium]MCI1978877.1 hypothetical protein [Bifidobacteriaceae bacterium]